MNKELLVAIGIGALLGLGVAVYFNNVPSSKGTTMQTSTARITLTPKALAGKQTVFKNLPKPNEINTTGKITVQGTAEDGTTIFVQTLSETTPLVVKKGAFSSEVSLKPGYNEIVISTHKKTNDQVKVLKLFYFQKNIELTSAPKEPQATSEAELLKDKLEKKVLELRENIKQAFYGVVQSVNTKEMVLKNDNDSLKVILEPEVTKFYNSTGLELENEDVENIEKGSLVTVFLSDIAGEMKSYTVYHEPDSLLVAGKISNVAETGFEVTLVNYDKTTVKADVESSTAQSSYLLPTGETEKYGFSKLKIGDDIFAVLNSNPDDTYAIDHYLVVNRK
ncbi:MAG: hypothetical protein WC775_05885 [Patescibacteria group bacterium]|jgi:hypothetical protein